MAEDVQTSKVALEIARQAPATLAVVFVCWLFIQHLGLRDQHLDSVASSYAAAQTKRDEGYKAILDRVATALDRNTEMLGRAIEVLSRFESK